MNEQLRTLSRRLTFASALTMAGAFLETAGFAFAMEVVREEEEEAREEEEAPI